MWSPDCLFVLLSLLFEEAFHPYERPSASAANSESRSALALVASHVLVGDARQSQGPLGGSTTSL